VPQRQALREHSPEGRPEYVGSGPIQRVENGGSIIDKILGAIRRLAPS
jgi:hypothetical protein